MGNLISVMSHCWGRGLEIILGDKSHIHNYEQGGIAQVRSTFQLWLITLLLQAGLIFVYNNEVF